MRKITATDLHAYLVVHKGGVTRAQIQSAFSISESHFYSVKRDLQLFLGKESDANLIATTIPGRGGTCLYRISGDIGESAKFFKKERRYLMSRLETDMACAKSIVKATDGRTREGREAVIIQRHLTRAFEDLADQGLG